MVAFMFLLSPAVLLIAIVLMKAFQARQHPLSDLRIERDPRSR